MSVKLSEYVDNVDYCWFDSSNVFYSELHDHVNELKTLYVTFKNKGITYKYEDVDVADYVLFKHDVSQGKAIHKLIKKYNGKPIPYKSVEEIVSTFNILNVNNLLLEGVDDEDKLNDIKYYNKTLILILNELNSKYGFNNYTIENNPTETDNEFHINKKFSIQIEGVRELTIVEFKLSDKELQLIIKTGDVDDGTDVRYIIDRVIEGEEEDSSLIISETINNEVIEIIKEKINNLNNHNYE